jgi:hypothetical protein
MFIAIYRIDLFNLSLSISRKLKNSGGIRKMPMWKRLVLEDVTYGVTLIYFLYLI